MGKPKAEGHPTSSQGYAPQETNPPRPPYTPSPGKVACSPTEAVYPPVSNPPYQTSNTTYSSPGNPAYQPGNAAYFPTAKGAHPVSSAANPPLRNAPYPPSNAAYPPPSDATTYPPPSMPVAFPPAGQQLPGYAGNPDPVPVKFPPEHYSPAPAFQQHASMAAAPSPGYPVRSLPPSTPGRVILQGSSPWTTELFDCMDDPLNAVTTLLLPCVTFGQIAEIVDEGRSTCNTNGVMYGCVAAMIGMPCLISCGYRSRLRAKFDLVETPAPDWAVHFILEPCALCQEYRELRNRGFDPEIGWHANVAKSQGVALTPPKNQAMIG